MNYRWTTSSGRVGVCTDIDNDVITCGAVITWYEDVTCDRCDHVIRVGHV